MSEETEMPSDVVDESRGIEATPSTCGKPPCECAKATLPFRFLSVGDMDIAPIIKMLFSVSENDRYWMATMQKQHSIQSRIIRGQSTNGNPIVDISHVRNRRWLHDEAEPETNSFLRKQVYIQRLSLDGNESKGTLTAEVFHGSRYRKQRAPPIQLLLMATGSTDQTTQSSLDGNN
jgi:hypothetical protein